MISQRFVADVLWRRSDQPAVGEIKDLLVILLVTSNMTFAGVELRRVVTVGKFLLIFTALGFVLQSNKFI